MDEQDLEELVTIDTILNWLENKVKWKESIHPSVWINAASKLNILISEEKERLYDLEQRVAQLKVSQIENGKSVAESKVRVEATNEHKEMKKQQARIERINEAIRLAKYQSRLELEEIKNY